MSLVRAWMGKKYQATWAELKQNSFNVYALGLGIIIDISQGWDASGIFPNGDHVDFLHDVIAHEAYLPIQSRPQVPAHQCKPHISQILPPERRLKPIYRPHRTSLADISFLAFLFASLHFPCRVV
jgi:hypothetical protein